MMRLDRINLPFRRSHNVQVEWEYGAESEDSHDNTKRVLYAATAPYRFCNYWKNCTA